MTQGLFNSLKPIKNESRRIRLEQKYVNKFKSKELTLQKFLDEERIKNYPQKRFLIVI